MSGARWAGTVAALLLSPAGWCTDLASGAQDPRIARSQELVARFQGELSGRLIEAMAAGGPVRAIEVCSREAPAIAARLSADSGAAFGRVALAVRNPGNAADAGEREVLEEFRRAIEAGTPEAAWHFEVAPDGAARYMKAIVTQPLCLACHGRELAPDVQSAIAQFYPADRATGFAAGDLRGAFVVHWPSAGADGAP